MAGEANVELGITGLTGADEVGSGGFATVYRARQIAFDRLVAVKVFHDVSVDDATLATFHRECQAVGRVGGRKNILVVYDQGLTVSGRPYMTMPFLAGGSLQEMLQRRGRLPWREAVDLGVKLAGALQIAHQAAVLHRDVKPANVLLDDDGEPQLADFGIARLTDATRLTAGQASFTPAHVAPEVLTGSAPSPLVDVYALGSTIFELIAGHPAFVQGNDDSFFAVMRRVESAPVPDLRPLGVPDAVCRVIESAMAKDPAERPESAGAMAVQLNEAREPWHADTNVLPDQQRRPPPPPPPTPGLPPPPPPPWSPGGFGSSQPGAGYGPESSGGTGYLATGGPGYAPGASTGGAGYAPGASTGGPGYAPPSPPFPPPAATRPAPPGYVPPPTAPYPGPARSNGRHRGALYGGIAAAVVVIAVIVAVALLASNGKPNSNTTGTTSGTTAPTTPASTAPPGTTASAQQEAQSLNSLLSESSSDRSAIVSATNNIGNCVQLDQAQTALQMAAMSRMMLLSQLAQLNLAQVPNSGALVSSLSSAWQASMQADQAYAAWAGDRAGSGCGTPPSADSNWTAAQAADRDATTAKGSFVSAWNPVAAMYGLPQYTQAQI